MKRAKQQNTAQNGSEVCPRREEFRVKESMAIGESMFYVGVSQVSDTVLMYCIC